ncbi:hypothetical protein [Bradyrhizobium glycinis]|uniref:hypothetical protein n=1 Tax=Bradyrhizobium glycinis TaxID=2751812 RepID=UPI0018D625F4|nr:hypothetical protein [Bradyrhizobium glycinis]MBH5372951.1 hypothetical protein [Bradyrhizobium glycinis]
MTDIVLMSVALDDVRKRAQAGDPKAIEIMARFFRDPSTTQTKRLRNDDLRALAQKLIVSLQCSPHRAATMLTMAGEVLQQPGRSLSPSSFGRLSPDELRDLENEVRRLIGYRLPWPCQRSMISICKL